MRCPNCNQQIPDENLPAQYTPLTPWQYFGLQILFSIPIIGFIFLIVFSINSSNLNRRNFARSYWCMLILTLIVGVIIGVAAYLLGFTSEAVALLR